jgi:hypothetical protein
MSFIRKFSYVKLKDKELLINWYFEDGDDDMLEQGEYISTTLEIPFNFIMTADFKTASNLS